MKIAISGKGGVGKTTISAGIARYFAGLGKNVLAVDADPNANLGLTLGFKKIPPALIEMQELIDERMESKKGGSGTYFRLNPRVDDIPEKYSVNEGGIRLIAMGGMKKGGSGCACPENAFIKALISHLILRTDEVVVMDMEAGLEHFGRGTAQGVDLLLVVVEPDRNSTDTAGKIQKLAGQIGIKGVSIVANKIRDEEDEKFIRKELDKLKIIGYIPYYNWRQIPLISDELISQIKKTFSNF